jgi:hypothetical protein
MATRMKTREIAWRFLVIVAVAGTTAWVASWFVEPRYMATAKLWAASPPAATTASPTPAAGATEVVTALKQPLVIDSVVKRLALYVVPTRVQDSSALRGFGLASRFIKGTYILRVDSARRRWTMDVEDMYVADTGAVGDSVGRKFGLAWRPDSATLANLPGRKMTFALVTPRETSHDITARLKVVHPPRNNIIALSIEDRDGARAARTLNGITREFLSTRSHPEAALLDSALVPARPSNHPAAVAGMWSFGVAGLVALLLLRGARRPESLSS